MEGFLSFKRSLIAVLISFFSWEQWEFWEHVSFPFHFQQLKVHLTVPIPLNTPWDRWERRKILSSQRRAKGCCATC
jgi:hypothetical protein